MNKKLKDSRAFALLMVISLVVLLSFLIAAFMGKSIQGLRISKAQASHYRSDCLARSALQTVVGDLLGELEDGSTIEHLQNGETVYLPKSRQLQFPTKNIATGQKAILKVSRAGVGFSAYSGLQSKQAEVSTAINSRCDDADLKGRKIPMQQWSRPRFQQGDDLLDEAPDWVLVSRNGLKTSTDSHQVREFADVTSNNPNYIIGRYAYVIYDQGGLLNANEAGAPSTADDDFKKRGGSLGQIDLSALPGFSGVANFANWRSRSAVAKFGDFKNNFFEGAKSCDQVSFGNRAFLSRKELLHYRESFPDQMSLDGLKYLSVFNRSLDISSVIPDKNRPKTTSENLALGNDDFINPSVFTVKNSAGGLLLKKRFPLSRLSILEKGTDAKLIEKYFGLKKSNTAHTWTYDHGDKERILRFSEIKSLNREPDFFETLKAAIWIGSLGKTLSPSVANYTTWLLSPANPDPISQFSDNQIISIGANLIDQWDQDSYPTRVVLDQEEISGIENLPYLYGVLERTYSDAGTAQCWYQPELWNPHQAPLNRSTKGPTQIRFVAKGSAFFRIYNAVGPGDAIAPTTVLSDSAPGVTCNILSHQCLEPTPMTKANATATGSDIPASFSHLGLFIGVLNNPSNWIWYQIVLAPKITFKLQYQIGSEWVTYNQIPTVDLSGAGHINDTENQRSTCIIYRGDPRCSRFGITIGYLGDGGWTGAGDPYGPLLGATVRRGKTDGVGGGYGVTIAGATYPGWTWGPTSLWGQPSLLWGTLSDNKANSTTRYKDPDGVLRGADGVYTNGSTDDGYPQIASNQASRPVILDRPFRSVGEMGYAFRDLPWKHLDFFTEKSADAALLDYFTIQESEESGLVSHQIALNTPYEEILTARLTGISKKEDDLTQVLTKTQAQTIAKKVIADLENKEIGPIQNRSELVTRLISAIDYGNNSDNIIKTRRESAIRALAQDSDTRTWNLLIDLVAQTGAYSKNSKKLSDFDVRGQTRYWLNVSIDRYTGKVLAQRWEKISD